MKSLQDNRKVEVGREFHYVELKVKIANLIEPETVLDSHRLDFEYVLKQSRASRISK